MIALPASATGFLGFLVGVAIGAAVWRARLCSFGAVEDALIGRDWRRMRVFGLALGIALTLTQLLIFTGLFDPRMTTYVPDKLSFLPIAIGAVMFGFGMAMVGTCAFGSLVRLGGGDLRSLVVLIIFGALAYAMQRGILAPLRISTVELFAIPMPGMAPSSVGGLSAYAFAADLSMWGGLLVAAILITLYVVDRRLRRARRLMLAGILLGLGVVAGWLATQTLLDSFATNVRSQSLTFVAPVGRTFFGLLLNTVDFADFGVGSVIGTIVGSFAMARYADEFRWNAFDDQIEMRRHLTGAGLMGVGGVLAGGCTIGQGLTAGSLLAITWPITVGGMVLGARLGIAYLVGERWQDIFSRDPA
jgi:uncharacterized membrane protein YedE/YeeE